MKKIEGTKISPQPLQMKRSQSESVATPSVSPLLDASDKSVPSPRLLDFARAPTVDAECAAGSGPRAASRQPLPHFSENYVSRAAEIKEAPVKGPV